MTSTFASQLLHEITLLRHLQLREGLLTRNAFLGNCLTVVINLLYWWEGVGG